MNKILGILVVSLLWCGNVYASTISDLFTKAFGDDLVYLKCDVDVDIFESGKTQYPHIGIGFEDADIDGAILREVVENSAAWKAGLKKGDIIIQYKEKVIKNSSDLEDVTSMKNKRIGDLVVLRLIREGKRYKANLTIGAKKFRGFDEDEVKLRKRFRYLAFKDEIITKGKKEDGSEAKGYVFSGWWDKANRFQYQTKIHDLNAAVVAFNAKPSSPDEMSEAFFLDRTGGNIIFSMNAHDRTSCEKISKSDLPKIKDKKF